MKILTKLRTVFVLILSVGLGACEDFLVEEPQTEITEASFFDSEENARLAVNGMYDVLGWGQVTNTAPGFYHSYEFLIGDICSDNAEKGSTDSDQSGIQDLKEFKASGSTGNIIGMWNIHWIAIGRANLVLKNLKDAAFDAEVKNEMEGEARFVRAYAYFLLARIYGGLPIFREPVTSDQINRREFTRAPLFKVYELIEEDLRFAMEHLPEKGVREIGRANKGAAAAYLARAIMYQLGTDNTNQHEWSEVLDLTDQFINGAFGSYALAANYAEIYEPEGENNSESIFEIQAVDTGTDMGGTGSIGPSVGSQWTVFTNPLSLGGWGFNTPSADLAANYEANDPRRPATALAAGEYAFGVQMIASERNKTGYYSRKAMADPNDTSLWVTQKGSGQNIRHFRYADILLMNAEAAWHQGNFGQAVARLTEIRNRASQSTYPKGWNPANPSGYEPTGFAPLDNSVIPASGPALLDFIYAERRRELGMEHLRFWDMVRTGQFMARMESLYGAEIAQAALDHSITASHPEAEGQEIVNPVPVFPIPSIETNNWNILQNRNY
ncbi:RagB/SusD family nutrient uptake outer membrane protein [Marinoscillum furvescens]|nr:RagB/SusD family nutrient uptake outer membrane protein [Marinoscillum furvescens]